MTEGDTKAVLKGLVREHTLAGVLKLLAQMCKERQRELEEHWQAGDGVSEYRDEGWRRSAKRIEVTASYEAVRSVS